MRLQSQLGRNHRSHQRDSLSSARMVLLQRHIWTTLEGQHRHILGARLVHEDSLLVPAIYRHVDSQCKPGQGPDANIRKPHRPQSSTQHRSRTLVLRVRLAQTDSKVFFPPIKPILVQDREIDKQPDVCICFTISVPTCLDFSNTTLAGMRAATAPLTLTNHSQSASRSIGAF